MGYKERAPSQAGKPRALKKFNQLNYSEEKENCKDGCKRNNQD